MEAMSATLKKVLLNDIGFVEDRVRIDYKLFMPQTPKEKKDGTVAEDQKERGYYYDDAHGYEEYEPEDVDDEESDESTGEERGAGPPFRTCE